jgi:acyl-CoA oxidase
LGHGSDVASLETTATLDKTTDEFIIHSPTVTSTKYWPGDLGRMTSHAVVFARLIIDENDYGVQPFMVKLRDLDTWKHLKGVQTGDLGPKFGYHSKDNGWARFDKVRIPRTDMLMGICDVNKDGEVEIKGDLRVLYSVMMYIRLLIVSDCGSLTLMGSQLALRYLAVRR